VCPESSHFFKRRPHERRASAGNSIAVGVRLVFVFGAQAFETDVEIKKEEGKHADK